VWLCVLGLWAGRGDSALAAATAREGRSTDAERAALRLSPETVDLGLFYGGADVRVEAELPGSGRSPRPLALVLEGAREDLLLKRKGRVGGILWMNVGDLCFKEVPTVYLLSTNGPLAELGAADLLRQRGIGYSALVSPGDPAEEYFEQMIALKERDGLYRREVGGIQVAELASGGVRMETSLHLPSQIPAGDYQLRLWGAVDGKVVQLAEGQVNVRTRGIIRLLRTLAFEHGLLYGCTAVLVALIAGFATGIIFGRGALRGGR
jgi:uncharacterized protein (TIGR02186 family)